MPQKKTKFLSVSGKNCESPLLPGRERCSCQAVKHPLVNNCLSCGRIVCIQEGAGPCFFCGEIVMTKEERLRFQTGNGKDAQRILNKYSKQPKPLEEDERKFIAEQQKEKLLEYDRNSVRRTQVIDDQSDYFAVESPWLSEEEKKVLQEKKEAYMEAKNRLKRKVKVTIDFAGRRMIEEVQNLGIPDFSNLSLSTATPKSHSKNKANEAEESETKAKSLIVPQFLGTLDKSSTKQTPVLWSNRLQDSQLQEMVDAGNCLSVNQPYASMIMDSIKLFEGRTWYTSVRGRLWIYASKKSPTQELLKHIKASYQNIIGNIDFPEIFPLGCLLGCVDLVDCIPQEEYLELYPNGEVSDPYVFVLANPQILPVRLPMDGKLKIFKLEQHIHQAAKRAYNKIRLDS